MCQIACVMHQNNCNANCCNKVTIFSPNINLALIPELAKYILWLLTVLSSLDDFHFNHFHFKQLLIKNIKVKLTPSKMEF